MGKKNYRLKEEKYREQVTRYSLRKLSIGVASVALFPFVLSSPQVHAATSSESNTSPAASVQTSGASASSSASTDDVRVAGNQASDGNLIDKTTTTPTTNTTAQMISLFRSSFRCPVSVMLPSSSMTSAFFLRFTFVATITPRRLSSRSWSQPWRCSLPPRPLPCPS